MCGFVREMISQAIVRSNSAHPLATRTDIWGGYGTARVLALLNLGETEGMDRRRRGQGLGQGAEK